jgi:hypothetical protein
MKVSCQLHAPTPLGKLTANFKHTGSWTDGFQNRFAYGRDCSLDPDDPTGISHLRVWISDELHLLQPALCTHIRHKNSFS